MRYLLVVTEDGDGKRVPVSGVRKTDRGSKGVKLSTVPVAAALVVGTEKELLIGTRRGKMLSIPMREVPVRARRVLKGGGLSKGARLVGWWTATGWRRPSRPQTSIRV
jgi:DNA gyrase/topoisomerase IV subunit A